MKIQCMNKNCIKYELGNWIEDLKKTEKVTIEITVCPVLNKTFNMTIRKELK